MGLENTLNPIEEKISQEIYSKIVFKIVQPDFEDIVDKALQGSSEKEIRLMCENFARKYEKLFK